MNKQFARITVALLILAAPLAALAGNRTVMWSTNAANYGRVVTPTNFLAANDLATATNLTAQVAALEGQTNAWNQAAVDATTATNYIGTNAVQANAQAYTDGRVDGLPTNAWNQAATDGTSATNRLADLEGQTNTWNRAATDAITATNGLADIQANTNTYAEGAALASLLSQGVAIFGPDGTFSNSYGNNLTEALSNQFAGCRIQLSPGAFEFDGVIQILDGVTISGAGRDATRIYGRTRDHYLFTQNTTNSLQGLTYDTGTNYPYIVVFGRLDINEVSFTGTGRTDDDYGSFGIWGNPLVTAVNSSFDTNAGFGRFMTAGAIFEPAFCVYNPVLITNNPAIITPVDIRPVDTLALERSLEGANINLGSLAMAGHISFAASNQYDIGSAEQPARSVYAGGGSYYVNGVPFAFTNAAGELVIQADVVEQTPAGTNPPITYATASDVAIASNAVSAQAAAGDVIVSNAVSAEAAAYTDGRVDGLPTNAWNQAAVDATTATNYIGTNAVQANAQAYTDGRFAALPSNSWNQAAIDAASATNALADIQADTNDFAQAAVDATAATNELANLASNTWNQAAIDAASATNGLADIQANTNAYQIGADLADDLSEGIHVFDTNGTYKAKYARDQWGVWATNQVEGDIVRFGPGLYPITSFTVLRDQTRLVGAGMNATRLTPAGGFMITIGTRTNSIENLTVKATNTWLTVNQFSELTLANVALDVTSGGQLLLADSCNVYAINCRFPDDIPLNTSGTFRPMATAYCPTNPAATITIAPLDSKATAKALEGTVLSLDHVIIDNGAAITGAVSIVGSLAVGGTNITQRIGKLESESNRWVTAEATAIAATNTLADIQANTNTYQQGYLFATNAYSWGDHRNAGYLTTGTNVFADLTIADTNYVGAELTTNGTFTGNADGWILTDCYYWSNRVQIAAGQTGIITPSNTLALVAGNLYVAAFFYESFASGGTLTMNIGGRTREWAVGVGGGLEYIFRALATNDLILTVAPDFANINIDNISVREVQRGELAAGSIGATNIATFVLDAQTLTNIEQIVFANGIKFTFPQGTNVWLESWTGTARVVTNVVPY